MYPKKMKIQFTGNANFEISDKKISVKFDEKSVSVNERKFELPGEFEVAGVLGSGIFSDGKNVVRKIILDEIAFVHFGNLEAVPDANFFEKLGENVDVIFVVLGENFDEKKAKELIEKIDPRMAILGGDPRFFPKITESTGAKTVEETSLKITRTSLSDDKTEILILEKS